MKVVLQKDVLNLGDAGDVKEVADGYARNFLIPRRFAVRANDGNTKAAVHQKRLAELKRDKRVKVMKELSASIEGKTYEIKVKVGENDKLFGSVTANDIALAIKNAGVELDKRKLDLGEPLKAVGEYKIKVRLAEGVVPQIIVKVVGQA
ncbi:50S ribosomal protein L9 [Leptospira terpstrae]|uniref:Large ribosomal subunit protein bL9 n=1 Tax=Leptospira terpstrae serovar Hualin str. LT 11-33 = ATCC 700639 TaxID=1257025 RepID=N1W0I9_9LEPT|nr:50S ribosomal protein L9 [Leptospira terpstrae]EMY61196.1 ribosomal protein L9 [Leptospira terpstrae serovar Hualin str. LT 11-33 = ATCC 700639]